MNNKYVSDTMALILRLEKRKMPKKVREKFVQAEQGKAEIFIPVMVFAELAYLSEKGRIDTNLSETKKYLDAYSANIKVSSMTFSTIQQAFKIGDIPELHDRLIAATGKDLKIPVLTNDPDISYSKHVEVLW